MSRKSVRIQHRKKNTVDSLHELTDSFRCKRKANEEEDIKCTDSKRRKIDNEWTPDSNQQTAVTSLAASNHPATSYEEPQLSTSLTPLTECSANVPTNSPQKISFSNVQPSTLSQFRFQLCFSIPEDLKNSPLPGFRWADSKVVWNLMLRKEKLYIRDPYMFDRHSALEPRMRSVLLDWLIEVCEVYTLHRETFHLAVDFCDRFLSVTKGLHKSQLQLIGITALFVASKLEEIYPPKLTDFAYLTDQACTEDEILDQELVMLKALKWDLTPMTPNSWLNVFLQLMNAEKFEDKEHNFLLPQYSQNTFLQIARLLDLCCLDIGSMQFEYSILATSATYHLSSEYVALSVSGYTWQDINLCVQWMSPFAMTLREVGPVEVTDFKNIPPENQHNIQNHAVDLNILSKAQNRQTQLVHSTQASPDFHRQYPGIITPPQSKGKEFKDDASAGRREKVLYEAVV